MQRWTGPPRREERQCPWGRGGCCRVGRRPTTLLAIRGLLADAGSFAALVATAREGKPCAAHKQGPDADKRGEQPAASSSWWRGVGRPRQRRRRGPLLRHRRHRLGRCEGRRPRRAHGGSAASRSRTSAPAEACLRSGSGSMPCLRTRPSLGGPAALPLSRRAVDCAEPGPAARWGYSHDGAVAR